ncbi:hypothetical protein NGW62_001927 [Escherichia coli]|nr:hypothetical protein [Escherichia coli]
MNKTKGCLIANFATVPFAELLLEDYKASLKYLSDHPKLQGIAQQNSFKHT